MPRATVGTHRGPTVGVYNDGAMESIFVKYGSLSGENLSVY